MKDKIVVKIYNHSKEIVNKEPKHIVLVKDIVVLKNNNNWMRKIITQLILIIQIIHNKDMNKFYKIFRVLKHKKLRYQMNRG